jgi:hypothetical protein
MPSEQPPARMRATSSSPTRLISWSRRERGMPWVAASARRWLRAERPGWKARASSSAPTSRPGWELPGRTSLTGSSAADLRSYQTPVMADDARADDGGRDGDEIPDLPRHLAALVGALKRAIGSGSQS